MVESPRTAAYRSRCLVPQTEHKDKDVRGQELAGQKSDFSDNDVRRTFAKRLAEARGDMPKTEFSDDVGRSDRSIRRYEKVDGSNVPASFVQVAKIANELGVSADWLLGLSDIKKPATLSGQRAELEKLKSGEGRASITPNRIPPVDTYELPVGVFDFAGQEIPMDLLFRVPKDRIRMGGFSPKKLRGDE